VKLYGDYTFSVVADKNVTKANEPVNVTITIHGEGNIDDIEDFKLEVPNATVYTDKPKRNTALENGKNVVVFKQKFALVSDRNFTIPALAFKFFNGKVQDLTSKAFFVEVLNPRREKSVATLERKTPLANETITEKIVVQNSSKMTLMIVSFLSFLLGVLATWLWAKFMAKKQFSSTSKPIQQKIQAAKDDKALLSLLLPYVDKTPKMQTLIKYLEENVYAGKTHKIDRASLAKEFESYLFVEKEDDILKA